MKRREFMKVVGMGLGGLVGLERLISAMSGDPAYAQGICYVSYSCSSTSVSCGYDPQYGYGFFCEGGYDCTSNFTCRDFGCLDASEQDGFGCKGSKFECPMGSGTGQTFDCQGVDWTHDQFYCRTNFTCNPGTRFSCDDFKCEEGNFICAASVGTMAVAYAASIQPK